MQLTMKGNKVTINTTLKVGDTLPEFYVVDQGLNKVCVKDLVNKKTIISFFPSLDTGVCGTQVKTFNEKLESFGDVNMINISCDLPFAQSRFCIQNDIEKGMHVMSDYQNDFGKKTGLLINELQILCRGVLVMDEKLKISYIEIVSEITDQVHFDFLV